MLRPFGNLMQFTAVIFVSVAMIPSAACLVYAWKSLCYPRESVAEDWRYAALIIGLFFATLGQILAFGFLAQGFQADSQSFAEPAPLFWVIANWITLMSWVLVLFSLVIGKGPMRRSMLLWSLITPVAAWLVIMMGYYY